MTLRGIRLNLPRKLHSVEYVEYASHCRSHCHAVMTFLRCFPVVVQEQLRLLERMQERRTVEIVQCLMETGVASLVVCAASCASGQESVVHSPAVHNILLLQT